MVQRKMFLKFSQKSQENIFAGVNFIKKED